MEPTPATRAQSVDWVLVAILWLMFSSVVEPVMAFIIVLLITTR
jgi:hypothetical protein